MIPVGRKGRDFFKRRSVKFADEYIGLTGSGQVNHSDAVAIANKIIDTFNEDTSIDKVLSSSPSSRPFFRRSLLSNSFCPSKTSADAESADAGPQAEYIYEQPAAEIFAKLLPKQVETQIYRGMLESVASEQGSRMTAMDSASKNAGELIDTLTLNMNRIRQAAITKEIIEVVSGAAAALRSSRPLGGIRAATIRCPHWTLLAQDTLR